MPRLDNLTLRERVHEFLKGRSWRAATRLVRSCSRYRCQRSWVSAVGRCAKHCAAWSPKASSRSRRGAGRSWCRFTKRDFLEAYQVRETLEALGVRLAVPRLSDADLDDLDARLDAMTELAAAGDVDAFFDVNAAFHEAIMEASQNRKLIEIYRRLMAQMGPYRRPSARLRGNVERSIAEHREILVAARQRDIDGAVTLLIKHVEVPQRMLEGMTEEEFAQAVVQPVPAAPAGT